MKEFVDLLIKKLEEISEPIRPVGWSRKIEVVETKSAIQIIKQVAEEYKSNLSKKLISSDYWIPCSERFPEENVCILGTTKEGVVKIFINDGDEDGEYSRDYFRDIEDNNYYLVTAWQPLPPAFNPKGD